MIIPAYNEELTIGAMLEQLSSMYPDLEVWVIDNNSSDKTNEIAKEKFAKLSLKGGVIFEARQGKAFAMRTAFHNIDADYYGMIDADNTYPLIEFKKMLDLAINENIDMVIGDRHTRGDYQKVMDRPFHNFGNHFVNGLINKLFSANIKDFMSGYRILSRNFVKNYPVLCGGFEIEVEMTIHALDKRFKLKEYPITFADRPAGSFSKLNTYRDGLKIIKTIFWIFKDYRPLRFFTILASIFFLMGIISGFTVIVEFLKTNYITHIPLAILATGLMLFSVIFCSIGLILDTIVKNHKFDYELRLLAEGSKRND